MAREKCSREGRLIEEVKGGDRMIIIQGENKEIFINPKSIYINTDLDGAWHIYADLSDTDRMKPEELTVGDYGRKQLFVWLHQIYKALWQQGGFNGTSIFISIWDVMQGQYNHK